MNRDLKSIIESMDRKTEYKKKSSTITKEGTLLYVGSEEGRQELAMVLKFVKGSQVGNPHEDYIVIGTYKYSDIDAAIRMNSNTKPPILLIVAKVTGKNSYKILKMDHLELMQKIKKVAGQDKNIRSRCNDLFDFELIQCLTTEMSLAYAMNRENLDIDKDFIPVNANMKVDLSEESDIKVNTIAIVEDQDTKYDTTSMMDNENIQAVIRRPEDL